MSPELVAAQSAIIQSCAVVWFIHFVTFLLDKPLFVGISLWDSALTLVDFTQYAPLYAFGCLVGLVLFRYNTPWYTLTWRCCSSGVGTAMGSAILTAGFCAVRVLKQDSAPYYWLVYVLPPIAISRMAYTMGKCAVRLDVIAMLMSWLRVTLFFLVLSAWQNRALYSDLTALQGLTAILHVPMLVAVLGAIGMTWALCANRKGVQAGEQDLPIHRPVMVIDDDDDDIDDGDT